MKKLNREIARAVKLSKVWVQGTGRSSKGVNLVRNWELIFNGEKIGVFPTKPSAIKHLQENMRE